MTRQAFIALLAGSVAVTACGGGDSGASHEQDERPWAEYGTSAPNYDPQAEVYRRIAHQQMSFEARAHMRELEEQQREWQRQKSADWARSFDNPYD